MTCVTFGRAAERDPSRAEDRPISRFFLPPSPTNTLFATPFNPQLQLFQNVQRPQRQSSPSPPSSLYPSSSDHLCFHPSLSFSRPPPTPSRTLSTTSPSPLRSSPPVLPRRPTRTSPRFVFLFSALPPVLSLTIFLLSACCRTPTPPSAPDFPPARTPSETRLTSPPTLPRFVFPLLPSRFPVVLSLTDRCLLLLSLQADYHKSS
jgi:hypothetical protein